MSEWNWVIAAYAVTWAVVAGYAVYLSGVMRRARRHAAAARGAA